MEQFGRKDCAGVLLHEGRKSLIMIFKGWKLYVNPEKIPKRKLKLLLKRFVDNGGELVDDLTQSDIILSLAPIDSSHGKIVNPNWISDSILQGKVLPIPKSVPAKVGKRVKQKANVPNSMLHTACLKPNPLEHAKGENSLIIQELEKLFEKFSAQGDRWRSLSYRKAIHAIEACHKTIRSGQEALKLDGVGHSIAAKINEILSTGHLAVNNEVPDE